MTAQEDFRRHALASDELASKAIDADYFNITDTGSWPVAGLLVLLDGHKQPVRSELQLHDGLPSHIQEGAIRQAKQVLQSTYSSELTVPMEIIETSQMRDAINVRLSEDAPESSSSGFALPMRLVAGISVVAVVAIAALLLFALGGGSISAFMAGLSSDEESPLAAMQEMVVSGSRSGADVQPTDVLDIPLPPSKNARADISVGTRVAIVPDLRLTLRSEPGADLGIPLGYMMDSDTAVVIDGPQFAEGTNDTIVWWRVRLDDGTDAWAAANTSDQTLLIPAE